MIPDVFDEISDNYELVSILVRMLHAVLRRADALEQCNTIFLSASKVQCITRTSCLTDSAVLTIYVVVCHTGADLLLYVWRL